MRFIAINEAYNILSKPDLRKLYDDSLRSYIVVGMPQRMRFVINGERVAAFTRNYNFLVYDARSFKNVSHEKWRNTLPLSLVLKAKSLA